MSKQAKCEVCEELDGHGVCDACGYRKLHALMKQRERERDEAREVARLLLDVHLGWKDTNLLDLADKNPWLGPSHP
jgi:hypothetical protein